jgi:hypothetical protein
VEQPSQRPFQIAIAGVAAVIIVFIGLLIFNIVSHALNKASTTRASWTISDVVADTPSQLSFTATIHSRADQQATISCVTAVNQPATPLAFQKTIRVTLAPHETKAIIVTRTLSKPLAGTVTATNVSFYCT